MARTNPFRRPGTPAEAAGAVYLLCTQDSNSISARAVTVDSRSR